MSAPQDITDAARRVVEADNALVVGLEREVARLTTALAEAQRDGKRLAQERDDWRRSAEKYVKGNVARRPEMGSKVLCFNFTLREEVVRSLGPTVALEDTFRRVTAEYERAISLRSTPGGTEP